MEISDEYVLKKNNSRNLSSSYKRDYDSISNVVSSKVKPNCKKTEMIKVQTRNANHTAGTPAFS